MARPLTADASPIEVRWRPAWPLDPVSTLAPLRHGKGDPTIRFDVGAIWRATRTPLGPATTRFEHVRGDGFRILAWGPGREWAVEAVPRLLGAEDDPAAFEPPPGLLRDLQRRHPGLRFGRSDAVLESLLPAIAEQKVTGQEARRAYRGLIRVYGEPAPGPGSLRLAPSPERLSALPYYAFHPLGLERRRAETMRRAAARAGWLEAAATLGPDPALGRLRSVPGIGQWTAAETARTAFGDPDAVSVGDYHVPNLVSWALAGEPRGDDARMLELLEPFRGQRARAVRLLETAGIGAPRYGPRMAQRSIGLL
jgi:3-methyladenine DNA glycosylase/8-oxoguanine DNA glycosylase